MLYQLQRHPFTVVAHFEHCLVLTYALQAEVLRMLLPAGLELDTFGPDNEWGFVAVALVQTRGLRPVGFPRWWGQDFFLSGYRIFTRFRTPDGRSLRGLRILRSDTDRRRMAFFGNLLTHYRYQHSRVHFTACQQRLEVCVQTPTGEADLEVTAEIGKLNAPLPASSCFSTERDALRFAGPLPYTFDYEPQTHSIISIHGRRASWHPRLVNVDVRKLSFLEQEPLIAGEPRLASAFHVANVPYRWNRGVRYLLNGLSK